MDSPPFLFTSTLRKKKLTFFPVIMLQAAFLLFYAIIPDSDYTFIFLGTERGTSLYQWLEVNGMQNPGMAVNIAFTILQTFLILNVYWIYKAGVKRNLGRKIKNKPFVIGVGGDSGVGKSTLTELLTRLFGQNNVTIIRGDDMHKWERGHDKWNELTHLSPKA